MQRSFWQAFWRLARPYWVSEDRWAGRALFATLVVLALAIVWVEVRLNTWNGQFYNALQEKNYDDFKRLLLEFCGWAFLFIVLAVYQLYFNQMLQMRWRRWLTDVYLVRWLEDATHYRLSLADFGTDNPDQRIAEDFRSFVSTTLALFFGLLSSVVTFISFVAILWALSGAIEIAGVTVPGYMVWVALVYALVGSIGAHLIGRPLIALNYLQERYEADFRFALVRARENAEGIALYRGEADELKGFRGRFANVVNNWWSIMKVQKRFTWFATFYGQLAIIFPMVVAAPRYFSGAIQLGGLTQISGAFGQVQRSLSWFVDAYVQIASLRASVLRLDQFAHAIQVARGLGTEVTGQPAPAGAGGASAGIDLGEVHIGVPERGDGLANEASTAAAGKQQALAAPVVRELILTDHQRIEPGAHTLISGPSGSGKSTLFRLLSGIWPFAQGRFSPSARDESLFLPQKPYLPLGTLRDAVAYPKQQAQFSDEQIRQALRRAMLPALAGELDRSANWSQTLSGGEQQRLAIARALLIRPRWLFLDEATSALDEKTEADVYRILREDLPDTTLVSIAHRAAVARYHRQRLLVQPQPDGVATLSLQPIAGTFDDA